MGDQSESSDLCVTFDPDIKPSKIRMSIYSKTVYDPNEIRYNQQLLDRMSGDGWVKLNKFPLELGKTLEREFQKHKWVGSYWKTICPKSQYVILTYIDDVHLGSNEWHLDYVTKMRNGKWNIKVLYRNTSQLNAGINPHDPRGNTWWVALPTHESDKTTSNVDKGPRKFNYSPKGRSFWTTHYLRLR